MSLCAKKKGFTLVELSIVMAVVIILASVSIVTFTKVIKAAKESAVMQEMKQRKEDSTKEGSLSTFLVDDARNAKEQGLLAFR